MGRKAFLIGFFILIVVPGLLQAQHRNPIDSKDNCIDLTDLNAPYIHCTYGSHSDPYKNLGVMEERHTVVTEQALDRYSPIYKIPPDETYSIQLGDYQGKGQAESIAVDVTVDTNIMELLVLKYAAVLQSANHDPIDQPRFRFEILDTIGNLINPDCLFADFVVSDSLGWNIQQNHGVYWKDWTSVGADISTFHGQTIRVRLTTFDCYGGHLGYAYFLLTCSRKCITANVCGDIDDYSYSAPSGFNYEWFWQDNPDSIISCQQTIEVHLEDMHNLGCHVTSLENPSCGFDLFTDTKLRFPLSGCSVADDGCLYEIHFLNESLVSNDGIHPDGTGKPCDDVLWDFGDGQTSYDFSPSHTYHVPGDYTVTMVAGLNGFECTDTTSLEVHIPEIAMIDTVTCASFEWGNDVYWESGEYHQVFTTASGCDSLATLRLDANYPPDFRLQGDLWPIGGTELAWTQYNYHVAFDNPYCSVDSIEWSIGCPTMLAIPSDDGLSCELRIFSFLPANDSVPLRAVAHNRCGTEERTVWIHTSYYCVDDHDAAPPVVEVFPNPTPGVLNIRMKGLAGETHIELYDARGMLLDKRPRHNRSDDEDMAYDVSQRPEGLYLLRVTSGMRTVTKRILVRR